MMNCQQATRLLSDAQERELSIKDRAALKLHVMMCSGCRNFARQMGTLRDIAYNYAKGSENEGDADTSQKPEDKRHE
ncbi:zf-HC2 domain-containing protein [Porticoccus sp.]